MELLLGCDPELFVKNKSGDFVSAHDLVPGTKEKPHTVDKGAVQVDGTALEFNIDPASNAKDFVTNITTVVAKLNDMVKTKNPELSMEIVPTAIFSPSYFHNVIPESAKIFGCDPDYNAYTQAENPKPETEEPFRTASGHIHIGWLPLDEQAENVMDSDHFMDCCMIVEQLDAILYPLSHLWDKDDTRRTLYGAKGAFRPKKYGVEYRVLSNRWLSDPMLMAWIFEVTKKSVEALGKSNRFLDDKYISGLLKKEEETGRFDGYDLLGLHEYYVYSEGIPSLPHKYLEVKDVR